MSSLGVFLHSKKDTNKKPSFVKQDDLSPDNSGENSRNHGLNENYFPEVDDDFDVQQMFKEVSWRAQRTIL